jgi:hypothetical protein
LESQPIENVGFESFSVLKTGGIDKDVSMVIGSQGGCFCFGIGLMSDFQSLRTFIIDVVVGFKFMLLDGEGQSGKVVYEGAFSRARVSNHKNSMTAAVHFAELGIDISVEFVQLT